MLELARLVDDEHLELGLRYAKRNPDPRPEIDERETPPALEDPPSGLEELRAVLLQEHVWRQREG